MIENLLFSMNTVLPMFIVILFGWILRKYKVLSDTFFKEANKLLFNIVIPIKLFLDVATIDFFENLHLKFIGVSYGVTILVFILLWVVAERCIKSPEDISAFVHSCFRSNYVMIGLVLIERVIGQSSVAPLIIAFVVPLYNVLAIIILTVKSPYDKHIDVISIIKKIFTNPLIIGIGIGIPFSIFQINLPGVLENALSTVGSLTAPLAFLVIGGSFVFENIRRKISLAIIGGIVKSIVVPLFVVICTLPFRLTSEELLVLYIAFASPSGANTYIMTRKMGGNADLNAGIILVSTILSVVTITIGIYFFKSLGLIP